MRTNRDKVFFIMSGFMIAAPQSGSGKTLLTLGILRAFRDNAWDVCPVKAGPDFLDPTFLELSSGAACINMDPWAMRPSLIKHLASCCEGTLIVEAMMGLFDGAADRRGSPADLASLLGLPVVLVIDCSRQSHSVAALVSGFINHRLDVEIAGVILNFVVSDRHETLLRQALESLTPVLGVLRRDESLVIPSRHLGLVRAEELSSDIIDSISSKVTSAVDIDALCSLQRIDSSTAYPPDLFPPLGQHISIARDSAFCFLYEHLLLSWREQGAEISFFSPLNDESPSPSSDVIFLPGGYPELHASRLSNATNFMNSLRRRSSDTYIYGECGGYMVLGEGLVDSSGVRHQMSGLLPLVTSFASPSRTLGYRRVELLSDCFLGGIGTEFYGHEFHYSTIVSESGASLFSASDARGETFEAGLCSGLVLGSYMHLVDIGGT